jgi:acetyltransferase-like isoleucine patch superfamily enzyme
MIAIIINKLITAIRQAGRLHKVRLENKTSVIQFGAVLEDSKIGEYTVLFKDTFIYKSVIGNHTYVQRKTSIYNAIVGPFCSIAENVVIGLAGHPTHYISSHPSFYDNQQPLPYFFVDAKKFDQVFLETKIGADVWIGHGAQIKSGVSLGVGSIVAAGAVVTVDVPAYSIVGGIPAKIIKKRFDEELCLQLEKSQWWTFSREKLKSLSPYFEKPEAFLAEIERVEK